MAKVQNLSEMLAKRKEELGSTTRFEVPWDDNKSFWLLDPTLASDEWRDEFFQLQRDFKDGELLPSEFYRTFIEMLLDDDDHDQSDELIALYEGLPSPLQEAGSALMQVIQERMNKADPTRKSSPSIPRNAKRR